jgi:hypothetical protein
LTTTLSPISFTERITRGEWPATINELPMVLTQQELAHLRGVTLRTLQRERMLNISIPYIRDGKKVLYPRHHVLERFGVRG